MRCVRLLGLERVEVRDVPDPRPEGDEVVVRMESAPICGSDLRALYRRPDETSHTPGHEGAGVVAAVDRPRRAREGDRVFLLPFRACGRCEMCRQGYLAYCRNSKGLYGFGTDGMQAEYVRVAEECLLPLPDWMSFDQAGLILDPVGTPYHAHRRIGTNATHTVGVFGLGPMGLGAVTIAAHLGAKVIGVDPIAYRRDLARKLGAAQTVDPAEGDVVKQVLDCTGGYGLDRALECSGAAEALTAALDLARPLGHVALIGESRSAAINPSLQFVHKEVFLSGSCCFPLGDYDGIIRMFASGLRAAEMITHRFTVDQAPEAYRTFAEGNTGKVVFVPGPS